MDALRNLPWARLQEAQVARLLYQTCRQSLEQHGESQVIWLLVSQLLERLSGSLRHAGEVRRLNRVTTATQSIDRYAARLGSVIPQGPSQEHFKMLSNLRNQNSSNTQLDALKLLIFSVSNSFVMAWNHREWTVYSSCRIPQNDPQEVVRLFQAAVMNDVSIMPRLIEAADTIPAISVFVKRLFDAALLLRSYDIAAAILHVIRKDSPCNSVPTSPVWETDHTPLAMAVRHRDIRLTSLLLRAGADPNGPIASDGPTPLENAAAIDSHDTAFELASLLFSHGAVIDSQPSSPSGSTHALSFAVMRGNFRLIELLVGRGANFGQVSTRLPYPDFANNSLRPRFELMEEISPEILAAGFCSSEGPLSQTEQEQRSSGFKLDSQSQFAEDQEIACHMVRYMLGQMVLPKTSSLCPEQSRSHGTIHPNAMIVAAYRGYHGVIRILHSAGASITALNSMGASPLSAAALRGDVGTCRFLMDLDNAYEDPMEFDHGPLTSSLRFPTALQIAVWHDNEELCQELLAHGADPNGPCACRMGDSSGFLLVRPGTDQYILQKYATKLGWNCLRMALLRKSAKVAKCLLENRHIHSPNQQDLLLAANLGDVEIMAKMLKAMRSPINARTTRLRTVPSFALGPQRWTHFRSGNEPSELMYSEDCQSADLDDLTALQVAAFEGNTNMVEFLLESGLEIVGAEAAYAFRCGPKSLIQLILDRAPESLHHKTLDGRSYLEMAFLGGHLCLIEFALGLDSSYYDSGALCAAVMAESEVETIRNLVKRRNCSLEDKDQDDFLFNTALSLAASMCRKDLVQELLAVNVNLGSNRCVVPDRPVKQIDGCGQPYRIADIHKLQLDKKWIGWHHSVFRTFSPTFMAILGQNKAILQDILTAGYRTDGVTLKAAVCREFPTELNERLVNACLSLEDGGGNSYTPLQEAIVHGKVEWVRLLLRNKADPRARRKRPDPSTGGLNSIDRTAFQLAVETNIQEITDMLLDEGVCVNEPAGVIDGMTALQIAARDGLLGVAIRLRALGADVNAHRALKYGLTALEAAALNGRIDLVQYLLDSGVLTTGTGRRQYLIATKLAERNGYSEISTILKEHRSWAEEDFDLFDKIEPSQTQDGYHPDEYTDDEREDILATVQALKCQRKVDDNRISESGGELLLDSEGEDYSSIGHEASSQSTRELGVGTTMSDDLVMHSQAYGVGAEIGQANEFDDDVQLTGDSEIPAIPQPSDDMGMEVAMDPLQHEAWTAWATGLDVSVTSGFGFPLSAEEERLFEEFTYLQEQV